MDRSSVARKMPWSQAPSRVLGTAVGQLVWVVGCVLAVLAFERMPNVAIGIVAVMTLGGLLAGTRRAPLALWWTLGVVMGGALALFS